MGVEAPVSFFVKLPFQGETAVCLMCGDVLHHNPTKRSDWRCAMLNGIPFYACTKHFPPDGASAEEFAAAYQHFLKRAAAVLRGEN